MSNGWFQAIIEATGSQDSAESVLDAIGPMIFSANPPNAGVTAVYLSSSVGTFRTIPPLVPNVNRPVLAGWIAILTADATGATLNQVWHDADGTQFAENYVQLDANETLVLGEFGMPPLATSTELADPAYAVTHVIFTHEAGGVVTGRAFWFKHDE